MLQLGAGEREPPKEQMLPSSGAMLPSFRPTWASSYGIPIQ